MIQQITVLKNVGKFKLYESSQNHFGKLTGIFATNGQGKSTLTSTLRSLSEKNPKVLIGRKTLGSTEQQSVKLQVDNGFIAFNGQDWEASTAKFEIFDNHFVSQNIYSGMQVDPTQRKELYKFIIGEAAIHLNERVNRLNREIAAVTATIAEMRTQLLEKIGADMPLQDFLRLQIVEDNDSKIEHKAKEVEAIKNKEKVSSRSDLKEILLPSFVINDFESIITKTLSDLSSQSENLVKSHFVHLGENSEAWIKKGHDYLLQNEANCPFCKTDTSSNALVKAFSDYFNESYNQFKDALLKYQKTLNEQFSEKQKIGIGLTIRDNVTDAERWSDFLPLSMLIHDETQGDYFQIISESDVNSFYADFVASILMAIEKKKDAPLECPLSDAVLEESRFKWSKFQRSVDMYNALVRDNNTLISNLKQGIGTTDLGTAEKDLQVLKKTKLRFCEEVNSLCTTYEQLVSEKICLEQAKELARQELEAETERLPKLYEQKINSFLEVFGADFRLTDQKKVTPGGVSSTDYKLKLLNIDIPLGAPTTPDDVPSFKNTLSEGDKSTLALSFFLAKLETEDISNRVLIFDDPISSQDSGRREFTAEYLVYYGFKAKQVIILSHDEKFLYEVQRKWRLCDSSNNSTLYKIDKVQQSNFIVKTSQEELTKSKKQKNIEKLVSYVSDRSGAPEDVRATIRKVCEDYLWEALPNGTFKPRSSLGGMIDQIRDLEEAESNRNAKENLVQYSALNAYSFVESHGGATEEGPIDGDKLETMCKLALKLAEITI